MCTEDHGATYSAPSQAGHVRFWEENKLTSCILYPWRWSGRVGFEVFAINRHVLMPIAACAMVFAMIMLSVGGVSLAATMNTVYHTCWMRGTMRMNLDLNTRPADIPEGGIVTEIDVGLTVALIQYEDGTRRLMDWKEIQNTATCEDDNNDCPSCRDSSRFTVVALGVAYAASVPGLVCTLLRRWDDRDSPTLKAAVTWVMVLKVLGEITAMALFRELCGGTLQESMIQQHNQLEAVRWEYSTGYVCMVFAVLVGCAVVALHLLTPSPSDDFFKQVDAELEPCDALTFIIWDANPPGLGMKMRNNPLCEPNTASETDRIREDAVMVRTAPVISHVPGLRLWGTDIPSKLEPECIALQDKPMACAFDEVKLSNGMLTTNALTSPTSLQHELSFALSSAGCGRDGASPQRPRMHKMADRDVFDETKMNAGVSDSAQVDLQRRKQMLELPRGANDMPPRASPSSCGGHIPQHSAINQSSQAGYDSLPDRSTLVNVNKRVTKEGLSKTNSNCKTKDHHEIQTSHACPRTVANVLQLTREPQSRYADDSRIDDTVSASSEEYVLRSVCEFGHQHESSSHAHVNYLVGSHQSRSEKSIYGRDHERERHRPRKYRSQQGVRNSSLEHKQARMPSGGRRAAAKIDHNLLNLDERL